MRSGRAQRSKQVLKEISEDAEAAKFSKAYNNKVIEVPE